MPSGAHVTANATAGVGGGRWSNPRPRSRVRSSPTSPVFAATASRRPSGETCGARRLEPEVVLGEGCGPRRDRPTHEVPALSARERPYARPGRRLGIRCRADRWLVSRLGDVGFERDAAHRSARGCRRRPGRSRRRHRGPRSRCRRACRRWRATIPLDGDLPLSTSVPRRQSQTRTKPSVVGGGELLEPGVGATLHARFACVGADRSRPAGRRRGRGSGSVSRKSAAGLEVGDGLAVRGGDRNHVGVDADALVGIEERGEPGNEASCRRGDPRRGASGPSAAE